MPSFHSAPDKAHVHHILKWARQCFPYTQKKAYISEKRKVRFFYDEQGRNSILSLLAPPDSTQKVCVCVCVCWGGGGGL